MVTEANDRGRIRASDGEREEYATMIRAAMSEGRLTLDEGDERLAAAYAVRYRDELPPLTEDLPDGGQQGPPGGSRRPEHPPREAGTRIAHLAGPLVARTAVLAAAGVAIVAAAGIVWAVGVWVIGGRHAFWPTVPLLFLAFALLRRAPYRRRVHLRDRHRGRAEPMGNAPGRGHGGGGCRRGRGRRGC